MFTNPLHMQGWTRAPDTPPALAWPHGPLAAFFCRGPSRLPCAVTIWGSGKDLRGLTSRFQGSRLVGFTFSGVGLFFRVL